MDVIKNTNVIRQVHIGRLRERDGQDEWVAVREREICRESAGMEEGKTSSSGSRKHMVRLRQRKGSRTSHQWDRIWFKVWSHHWLLSRRHVTRFHFS